MKPNLGGALRPPTPATVATPAQCIEIWTDGALSPNWTVSSDTSRATVDSVGVNTRSSSAHRPNRSKPGAASSIAVPSLRSRAPVAGRCLSVASDVQAPRRAGRSRLSTAPDRHGRPLPRRRHGTPPRSRTRRRLARRDPVCSAIATVGRASPACHWRSESARWADAHPASAAPASGKANGQLSPPTDTSNPPGGSRGETETSAVLGEQRTGALAKLLDQASGANNTDGNLVSARGITAAGRLLHASVVNIRHQPVLAA